MGRFDDRVVVVTGGASGIGEACVRRFVAEGACAVVADVQDDRGAALASELGERAEYKTFFHGHTYTGNPLACAAALASLDLFKSDRVLERTREMASVLGRLLDQLSAVTR